MNINAGDCYEVRIDRLIYGGEGLGRIGEYVVFVPACAPGDLLRVRITSVEKRHLRAEIVSLIEPSPRRRTPACAHFGRCGGCQLQHIDYQAQLEAKAGFIRDAISRIGRIDYKAEIPVLHGVEFNYRSRAQFKIGRTVRPPLVGFYRSATHEVCDVDYCAVLNPALNNALRRVRASETEVLAASYTKVEVAAGEDGRVIGTQLPCLSGDYVEHSVHGIRYRYSAGCFFQVNSGMLEILVDAALSDRAGDTAIDLYAGVGLFSLQLARRFRRVMATEVGREASRWAVENIRLNGFENVEYSRLSAERFLERLLPSGRKRRLPVRTDSPDLLLLDPPRAGASPKVIESILRLWPQVLVYVSCDPATLARDLKVLVEGGYCLESITGVDLFPQSYHIETVSILKAKII